MRVCIFGTGYVGLVTGACLVPIYESGLAYYGIERGRSLHAT